MSFVISEESWSKYLPVLDKESMAKLLEQYLACELCRVRVNETGSGPTSQSCSPSQRVPELVQGDESSVLGRVGVQHVHRVEQAPIIRDVVLHVLCESKHNRKGRCLFCERGEPIEILMAAL